MTIAKVLAGKGREILTVALDMTVTEAITLLDAARIGAAPVVDGDRVVGVFSERDVINCLASGGAAALEQQVGHTMTAPAITVSLGDPVLSALGLMTRRRIRHLPVMEGDRMIGLVSIGDLVNYRIEQIEAEAGAMRSYIQTN